MADISHLEQMSRELKCPICLSLLNSAVSLTCNHVFCKLCIGKSMKSASNCPVCKIPYQRREVRPAPHMDNLVSIYKGMEAATGVNVFAHTGPLTKLSGEENNMEGNMICETDESKKICKGTPKEKTSRRSFKNKSKSSRVNIVKPSFPAKKRVQVPKHPQLETPVQSRKSVRGKLEQIKDGAQSSSSAMKDGIRLDEKEKTLFAPFFWLRNESDPEISPEKTTDGDNLSGTPPYASCFSNLKDSEDVIDCEDNSTPVQSALHPVLHEGDIFDSEMFEWTQRPCSPELYSSPSKLQSDKRDGEEMECKGTSHDAEGDFQHTVEKGDTTTSERASAGIEVTVPAVFSCGANRKNSEGKTERAKKRATKTSGNTQRKKIKRVTDDVPGGYNHLQSGAGSDMHEKEFDNCEPMNLKETTCKRDKKVSFTITSTEATADKICSLHDDVTLDQVGKTVVIHKSDILDLEQGGNENHQKGLTAKKKTSASQCRNSSGRSTAQNLGNDNNFSQLQGTSIVLDDEATPPNVCPKFKEDVAKNSKAQKHTKALKLSTDNSKVKVIKSIRGEDKENANVRAVDSSLEMKKTTARPSSMFLHKCDASSSIQCAFCQLTEDSNVAGIMVHYLNGKSVAADSGGLGVIHAHKECSVWAPNVYFEDETAINLEHELSRSRRIKCCSCGVKGASLGCYEKSCRRSYHFPCAKLIPECRWDNENFVMLCPLHESLTLPIEESESHLMQKKKSVSKRQSSTARSQVAVSCGVSANSRWKSHGLFKKMIISCSALTSEDKEIVRDFEKLSGVTVLKTWDSSVTHIVTSTDENGASRRTLKFLMGILEGKWILSSGWVKACMKAREPVGEQDYEINSDVHGVRDGPRLGRLRLLNKQPKLFSGYEFYCTGDFVPSYKRYLQDLIIAAGGTVLNRKPLSLDQEITSTTVSKAPQTLLIYSLELPDKCSRNKSALILKSRQSDAEALARSTGALAVSNKWILNSIAACKLQNRTE